MQLTSFQTPEIRDSNDNIIQTGAFGKNTALANAQNTGWIDYVANDLVALKNSVDILAYQQGSGDTSLVLNRLTEFSNLIGTMQTKVNNLNIATEEQIIAITRGDVYNG